MKAQPELVRAQASWFHVFKSMVESGDVAKMGPGPVSVYLVIKSYSNWKDGRAFPALTTICEKSGMSKPTVVRHLKKLEEHGYIRRDSGKLQGRSNRYTLREKVVLRNEQDEPTAIATWDYLPSTVKAAVAELRNVALKGNFEGVKLINIERLTLNVKNLAIGHDFSQINTELEKLPPDIRESFLRAYNAAATKEKELEAPKK